MPTMDDYLFNFAFTKLATKVKFEDYQNQIAQCYGYADHAAFLEAVEASKQRAQRDNAEWRQRQREQRREKWLLWFRRYLG